MANRQQRRMVAKKRPGETYADVLMKQKLSDMEREDYRPPCDFCEQFDYNKKKLKYEGRETKYCPFCGRKFKEVEHD